MITQSRGGDESRLAPTLQDDSGRRCSVAGRPLLGRRSDACAACPHCLRPHFRVTAAPERLRLQPQPTHCSAPRFRRRAGGKRRALLLLPSWKSLAFSSEVVIES